MTGLRRYANKRDNSERAIFAALKKMGCLIEAIDKPVDALILFRGKVLCIEIKTGKGKLTKSQEAFASNWPVAVLRNEQDAVELINSLSKVAA